MTAETLEPIRLRHPIDPTVDCVFKALFGQEENKGLLIHFLNSILRPASPIAQVTYINPINDPLTEHEKLTVIDLRAIDEAGITYHIEMQLRNHDALSERMLHNWSTVYHKLLKKGEEFEKLTPVISIWLLGQKLLPSLAHHHHFQVWDATHSVCLSNHFHIHTLELKKWRRPAAGVTLEDQWLQFFRYAKGWQELPVSLNQNPQMRQAMTVLKHFSDDDKARYEYERRMQALSVQATIDNSRKRTEEKLQQTQERLKEANERLDQTTALVEQEAARAEQEAARAEQEAARAEQEAARAAQEAARAEQEAAYAQQAQKDLQSQTQSLRQNLKNLYVLRFNSPPASAISDALDAATLDQLNAWLLRFAVASPAELLSLVSSAPAP